MLNPHSLLAATDFSEDGRNACRRAALVAKDLGASLEMLHVLSKPALTMAEHQFPDIAVRISGNAHKQLDQLAAQLSKDYGIRIVTSVETGSVTGTILSASARSGLLAVGVRGNNPLRDMILGTTSERLLGLVPRPILVVKQPPAASYRRVLAAIDFSPYSDAVLDAAARIAPAPELYVCNAFEPQFEGLLWLAGVPDERINACRIEARQQSLDGIRRLINANPLVAALGAMPTVARGDPARVILDQEAVCGADLIVIGRQGHSEMESFLLGSVTRHVLSDSKCDVLVINIGKKAADPPAHNQAT